MSEKTAEVSFEDLKKAGMIQSPQGGSEKPPPNFVYKRELGNGGMGIVYEGIGKIQRRVAIKVMTPKGQDATRKAEERFRREGEILKRLKHRNIVELYDTFIHEGNRYIIMEYLDGKNLHDFVREDLVNRSYDERIKFTVRVAIEISRGLLCAHANQIIHRDIKPANIFVCGADGPVKVLDFGIAKEMGADSLTSTADAPFATPEFAPPEQVLRRETTERSDIYAMGGVLYFCLTGQAPFPTTRDVSIFERERKQFSAFDRLPRNTPPDLVNIIHRCLLYDPMHRYPTILDLLEDLDRLKPERKEEEADTVPVHLRNMNLGQEAAHSGPPRTRLMIDLIVMLMLVAIAAVLGGLLHENWSKVKEAAASFQGPPPAPPPESAYVSNPALEAELETMRMRQAELEAENSLLRERSAAQARPQIPPPTPVPGDGTLISRLPTLAPAATPEAQATPASTPRPSPVLTATPTGLQYIVWADQSDSRRLFVEVVDPNAGESDKVPPSGPHMRMETFNTPEEAMAVAIERAYREGDGSVKWGIPGSLEKRGELPLRIRGGYNVATKRYDRNLVTVFRRQGVRHIADVEPLR